MLKWLLKSLLILAVFVPFAAALPLASVSLCRTPDGAQYSCSGRGRGVAVFGC